MKRLLLLVLLLLASCHKEEPIQPIPCCDTFMSLSDNRTYNIRVCNVTNETGYILQDDIGQTWYVYYGEERYNCICEERRLDNYDFTIPSSNYSEEQPYEFNIFDVCD
ncbi:MAG: hypothetical protein KKD48_00335 [Nanoarchaeota archaeon]|nr:hypothetical protein [Nanoarchaeota archaeon]